MRTAIEDDIRDARMDAALDRMAEEWDAHLESRSHRGGYCDCEYADCKGCEATCLVSEMHKGLCADCDSPDRFSDEPALVGASS